MSNMESRNLKLKTVKDGLIDSVTLKNLILEDADVLDGIIDFGNILAKSVMSGNKVLIFGNGGSAGDAQHMAAEMVGTYVDKRRSFPAIAITVDSSVITAVSNDIGYDAIFARQIEALGNEGDVLVGISTSGNSTNVINAINAAITKKLKVIVLTGKTGGSMVDLGDVSIRIPSNDTQRIQECHLLVEHIFCESVEASILN